MSEPKTLLIEGWRFIPHSYALVNQFQCLELLRRPEIRVRHRDVPFYQKDWRPVRGCIDASNEMLLREMCPPENGDHVDAIYRIAFPYHFSSTPGIPTFVFGTSEFGQVPPICIAGNVSLGEALAASNSVVITPSQWSKDGFIRSGADAERVVVIPHGFDPTVFKPLSDDERRIQRTRYAWNEFVFLSVGAMTANKGIGLLFKAFAAVAARYPNTKLVLKGMDALYRSQEILKQRELDLSPAEVALIEPRLQYHGMTLSFREIALLYQMADAYVAPYFGEGFALPVLEAIACGCPAICTASGPTDDFTTSECALRIDSQIELSESDFGGTKRSTVPSLSSLIEKMMKVIEDRDFAAKARVAGPLHVNENFTWKIVVDKLLRVLLPDE